MRAAPVTTPSRPPGLPCHGLPCSFVAISLLLLLITHQSSIATAAPIYGVCAAYAPLARTEMYNCMYTEVPPAAARGYYVALNRPQYALGYNCGACVRMSCRDTRCLGERNTVTAVVIDSCVECPYGWLDVSPTVMRAVTGGRATSLYEVEWDFVDCGEEMVPGPIKLQLHPEIHDHFFAVNVMNSRDVAKEVSLQLGQSTRKIRLKHEDWNYYTTSFDWRVGKMSKPYTLHITSSTGETLRYTLNTLRPGQKIQTNIQFTRGGRHAPSPYNNNNKNRSPISKLARHFDSQPASAGSIGPDGSFILRRSGAAIATVVTIPRWRQATIALNARGNRLGGEWPIMHVKVDGTLVASWFVDGVGFRWHFVDVDGGFSGRRTVSVELVNEFRGRKGGFRAVHLDTVKIYRRE